MVPRHELILDEQKIAGAVESLNRVDAKAGAELAEAFETEVHPPGIEGMAANLGQDLGSFLEYVGSDAVVLVEEPGMMGTAIDKLWGEIQEAYQSARDSFPHLSKPDELFLQPRKLRAVLETLADDQ